MNINKEIHGSLTEADVKQIIQDYLKIQGFADASIFFNIRMEADKDDYFAERPTSPVFKGISFVCKSE